MPASVRVVPDAAPGPGVAQVALAGVLWGTAPVAFDLVRDGSGLGPVDVSALRLGVAAVVLVVVAAATRRLAQAGRALRRRPAAVVVVGIGVAGYQALWFAAITQVGAGVATVISLGLAPVLVTAWESLRTRRPPGGARTAVLAAAVVGLVLVAASGGEATASGGGSAGLGVLLAAASGTLYAATTVVGRHLAGHVDPIALTTSTTVIGALALLPAAALAGAGLPTTAPSWAAVGYLGVVTMAGGYLLLYSGLRTAPASAATVATLLEPAAAAVLAVALLGERLTPAAVVGILLILVAVAVLGRRRATGTTPVQP